MDKNMKCGECGAHSPEEAHEAMVRRTDAIIERVGTERRCIIPLLQTLQAEFGFLPSVALNRVYERTEIDRAQMMSVATFYAQFRLVPYGKHTIRVCTGTACHVKGADAVFDAFCRALDIAPDSVTTADGLYSVEKIACLGCCALAPVVQIDQTIFGHVQPGRVKEVLEQFEQQQRATLDAQRHASDAQPPQGEVRLGMENCCQASGTAAVKAAVEQACEELDIKVEIKPVSCVGACNQIPLIDVAMPDGSITRYPHVKPEEVKEILLYHFRPASRWKRWRNALYHKVDTWHTDETWDNILYQSEQTRTQSINTFLGHQLRISTEGYGKMNPLDIDEYRERGGFEALKRALTMSRQEVIDEVTRSGIRGRGGGGFLTGRKWNMVAVGKDRQKYVVCNGDEGDPGAFMDRILLESYPFRVIEGLAIAAYAVGADKGILYVRAEYPQAVVRVRKALAMCREQGLIGLDVLGSGFSVEMELFEGAGAFVCGEETALIASIEGKRGFPHLRPPYPAQRGLWGHPTLINNVETLSQIPFIVKEGAEAYAGVGTKGSKGTKVFALAGKVKHGGLIEVPMGTTLRQIVEEIGGGMEDGETLKAVQTGGPSGGCIPAELCDVEVDFDALNQMGAIMGSGGLVVLSESDCMVDVAKYFLQFVSGESCGKCTFCRVGARRMLELLEKICTGIGTLEDVEKLETLAEGVKKAALCGLGRTAPNPVLSTLRYFRHEYEEHVSGVCRTGSCKRMVRLRVTDDCVGCTKCAKCCPADAIPWVPYEKHVIDVEKCTMCGLCMDVCDFKAIVYENKG